MFTANTLVRAFMDLMMLFRLTSTTVAKEQPCDIAANRGCRDIKGTRDPRLIAPCEPELPQEVDDMLTASLSRELFKDLMRKEPEDVATYQPHQSQEVDESGWSI